VGGVQKLCIWSGVAGATLLFLGLVPLMGFIPPIPPSADATAVAAVYRHNGIGIIAGCSLLLGAFGMMIPFYSLISAHIERMEPAGSPLAKAQLGLAILAVCVPGTMAAMVWMVAAYRPGRSADTILLLNDLGWMLLLAPVVSGLLQNLALGIAVFNERSAAPTFPRWFAYFNFWTGMAFLPGGLLGFFKTGPFAWNGFLCFWLGLSAFGVWFVVTVPLLFKAANCLSGDAGTGAKRFARSPI